MVLVDVANLLAALEVVPTRLESVTANYVTALMSEAQKHTLKYAAGVMGGSVSNYSRLLSDHTGISKTVLTRLGRLMIRKLERQGLIPKTPWKIFIIVDGTPHPRSSRHVQNAKSLNHGDGFFIGHNWTNIVVVIGSRTIPLPPIPFYTKKELRERGLKHQTEHQRVIQYLTDLNLAELVGTYEPKEVVVLLDSGYDDKEIIKAVLAREWDAVWALKTNRGVFTEAAYQRGERKTRRVDATFKAVRKQAPWETIRPKAKCKRERRRYRARSLTGRVKGIAHDMKLVCSEKSGRTKGRRYLACTRKSITSARLILCYEIRWRVERFHRATKSRLGMTEAGLVHFDALHEHVHWVYCAYILLDDLEIEGAKSMEDKQRAISKQLRARPFVETVRELAKTRTQFGGAARLQHLVAAAIRDLEAA
jgi:hypothetical protein